MDETHEFIEEVKIVNQFNKIFDNIIEKYSICSSICGYLAPVIGLYIVKNCTTIEEFPKILENLKNYEFVLDLLEDSIKFIHSCRVNYIEAHKSEFQNESDSKGYIKDWVANYEISDFLRSFNFFDIAI